MAMFGSPKVPMTPEAVALHAIDNLDTRINICVREIKDDRGHSPWTQFNQALQRKLYKGGSSTETRRIRLTIIEKFGRSLCIHQHSAALRIAVLNR